MRPSNREPNALRSVQFTRQFTMHAEGSVLVEYGNTKVLCTASVQSGVPPFLKGTGQGWITAEYGMLPRATHDRSLREAARGKQTGRTFEIQRLIGRALRTAVDLKALGENTITLDCDVLQADGGTRTAAITGSCVALVDALLHMKEKKMLAGKPLKFLISSVSVGIYQNTPVLDLDYAEDSSADTDMNIVFAKDNGMIEIQGTAEKAPFNHNELGSMIALAEAGSVILFEKQEAILSNAGSWQDLVTQH